MIEQVISLFKSIGAVGVTIAVVVGVIGGIWSLWDRIINRKPILKLFTPYYFSCKDGVSMQPVLMILVRISNSSQKSAFLYLETMSIEVMSNGKWYKTKRLNTEQTTPLKTDFSEAEKVRFGINDVKYLNRFGCTVVSYDNPLSGYVPVAHEEESVLTNIDKIRIKVTDCHFKSYEMEVDLKEQQRNYDPDYQFDKSRI